MQEEENQASDNKGTAASGKGNEQQKTNDDGRDLRNLLMRAEQRETYQVFVHQWTGEEHKSETLKRRPEQEQISGIKFLI